MGLFMKGKEAGLINEKYGTLIGTLKMSSGFVNPEDNYNFLKRIVFKEYYGTLIHSMLNSDKRSSFFDIRKY